MEPDFDLEELLDVAVDEIVNSEEVDRAIDEVVEEVIK